MPLQNFDAIESAKSDSDLIPAAHDPMGAAILDYFRNGKAARLRVLSSMFEEDEIPVEHLFRTFNQMPEIEQEALRLASGRILDVGAGSGCHALELQNMGKTVTAIDISPLSVQVMTERGVADARLQNVFAPDFTEKFDTILLLMNGTTIVGATERLPDFFRSMSRLLAPGGSILIDSSDLRYIYEDEDGAFSLDLNGKYYGEVDFQIIYKNIKGEPFDCLYADFGLLQYYANLSGFKAEMVMEGEHYDYLARITPAQPK